jgi:hypothetical protein
VGQERLGPSHFFHTISARPPKQPRMVRTFLKVHTRPRLAYALRGGGRANPSSWDLEPNSGYKIGFCRTRGAEVTESSTNKKHHLSPPATNPLKYRFLHTFSPPLQSRAVTRVCDASHPDNPKKKENGLWGFQCLLPSGWSSKKLH